MKNIFGEGYYIEGSKSYKGKIAVDEHKFYLIGPEGDFAQSYVPLGKIERIRQTRQGVELRVKLSAANSFNALIKGKRQELSKLVKYLVRKLNLKKKFLKKEWAGEISFR